MCLKAVGQLLDFCSQNFREKQCMLDALVITMTSNTCKFMYRDFTQTDSTTICRPELASLAEIYGAVFIDSKTEEIVTNKNVDWKRYRDDSFSMFL